MRERCCFLLMLLTAVLAGCGRSTTEPAHLVEERWPDGSLHIRRSVVSDWRGEEIHHGPVEVWYENGRQRSIGHWQHGRKHGLFTYWYENGQKKMELTNVEGRAHGRVMEWSADGQVIRDEEWRDGKRVAN
ncbi:MAG: hypothetical protein KF708_09565 [Pirellulales bacterium]|nr:hypothetical protein [Pirellulales bacterium]